MIFLVDSCVLLDVLTADARWLEWSTEALARCGSEGTLAINPIIYAEVSIGYARIEALEEVLPEEIYERLPLPWEAAFLAGKCFVNYRRSGGARTSPLSDFYIGAHAAVSGMSLVTRDAVRFRGYFPTLSLIAP